MLLQHPVFRAYLPRALLRSNMSARAVARKQLWLDVDTGVDDAQAMLLVLAAAQQVELLGVSVVHGNVGVAQVCRNVARVLALCGAHHIPFYLGAHEPLLAPLIDATYFHGKDGLGDAPTAHPAADSISLAPRPGHAAVALVEAAAAARGELEVLALGPLTNLALACKLDPQLPQRVKRLVVMGGAEATGNVTPYAEYNFFADPEAAHLVLRAFPQTVLVSWECTLRHALPWGWVEGWLAPGGMRAAFMAAVMAQSAAAERLRDPGVGWIACDPLAAAVAVEEGALLRGEPMHCAVELADGPTRGMSVLQAPGGPQALPPNVLLVHTVCLPTFQRLMHQALHG